MCYCCGKSGHKSPECPEKDTRAKSDWAIKKAELFMQQRNENNDDIDDDASVATTATNKSTK